MSIKLALNEWVWPSVLLAIVLWPFELKRFQSLSLPIQCCIYETTRRLEWVAYRDLVIKLFP